MINKSYITLLIICISSLLYSQELNCEVSVVAPDVSKITADPKVFQTLENTIFEFMNNKKWTNDVFEANEKIECSVFININTQSGNNYTGSITVVSKRPVFNSNYKTTVLNVIDNDFKFSYKEFAPIELVENQFASNLSHVLAFYANMIIALDYETFSENGGENYLLKAQELTNIVSSTEANIYKGWKSFDSNKRSRYWLITNMLNTRYEKYRNAMYNFHRMGLDNFYTDPVMARDYIKSSLKLLAKISEDNPNIYIMQMWSETKRKESIAIFKDAPDNEKAGVIDILKKIDPVNADKYDVISK